MGLLFILFTVIGACGMYYSIGRNLFYFIVSSVAFGIAIDRVMENWITGTF